MDKRGKLNIPLLSVFATYEVPRSVSVAVTVAPAMAAPPASTTVPVIAAVVSWAEATGMTHETTKRTIRMMARHTMFFITPPKTSTPKQGFSDDLPRPRDGKMRKPYLQETTTSTKTAVWTALTRKGGREQEDGTNKH